MSGVDLDLELAPLFEERQSRVSKDPPTATIEVVRNQTDPSKGYITLEVRGFVSEDDRRLRKALSGAFTAYYAVQGAEARRIQELNPAGDTDPSGAAFAKEIARAESEDWSERASLCLIKAARDICFLGVIGYELGQLRNNGRPIPYTKEDREVFGQKRTGLSMEALIWLERGEFLIRTALQILLVSEGKAPRTKEEQWPKEAAPNSAPPLEAKAPVGSQVN